MGGGSWLSTALPGGKPGGLLPARRRVPASDFRQFICRKSMKFPGDPAKPVLRGNRNAPRSPPFALSEDGFCCTPAPRLPRGFALPLRGDGRRRTRAASPAGDKISENRRLTRNGKTDILRPLSNRTRPEGGAQDDQRKHGLVRIGRKEAWTEGALRTHAALRSKTAFFCALSVFLQDGERFFAPFRRSLLFCKEDIVSWNRKPSSRPGKRPR